MWQVFNVNAAGGNVGSDQNANIATFETCQGLCASGLAFVTVQGHGLDAVLGEVVSHIVGAKLGAREDQHLAPVMLVDDVHQHFFFLTAAHRVNHLRNTLNSGVTG